MTIAHPVQIAVLADDALFHALADYPVDQITVTGFAGSGYSLLTDRFGEDVFHGPLPVAWTTGVLVVMRQNHVSAETVRMLQQLGVAEPEDAILKLRIGQGIVISRTSPVVPSP